MDPQIYTANSLDALLVLGGESSEHNRSHHAHYIYSGIKRKGHLDLVLTGRGSGLNKTLPVEPESVVMQKYLYSLGVPEKKMHLETESLDTLGNMIFSQPILNQILSSYVSKKIGLVTDRFHMSRSMWIARRVFGTNFYIEPLPAEQTTSLFGNMLEFAVKTAWRYDLWRERIVPGNQQGFDTYMREKHPFHVNDAPLGTYKVGIHLLKTVRKD
ncbi:YdcF family protein [Candidatus Woesearchaeota archaeon]|nr:YdcF family protein [Candidatus Woesearchaeota archaeon]